jgi:hypothetical protein
MHHRCRRCSTVAPGLLRRYLVSDSGESVLVTHGHYFEAYCALASDWLMRIASDALAVETPGQLNLQELVGMNLPLSQLA